MSDPQFQNKGRTEGARTSVSTSSNMRKASSTTNIVDDLSSIFGGNIVCNRNPLYWVVSSPLLSLILIICQNDLFAKAAPSSGAFQEVEGETEDRRRARLERHQRTQERAVCILFPIMYGYCQSRIGFG